MYIKKSLLFLFVGLCLFSCKKKKVDSLAKDLEDKNISCQYIIACAAGMQEGFMGDESNPVSFFFYPVTGATNYRVYESTSEAIDEKDYKNYLEKDLTSLPVFNGKLRRFPMGSNKNNRWAIITYEVNDSVRICDPVHIKIKDKPTDWVPELVTINSVGVNPEISWTQPLSHDNAIFFQVISELSGDLISGTYTYDLFWNFYDLSNVVLNIHAVTPAPTLEPNTTYKFTIMGVSKDNWVNLFAQKDFTTQ